jgi:trimeric autotransporter adhesin
VKQLQKRLTYANVMSSIAVFLILGGATAFAAKKIGSNQLKANSVTTAKIKKNAVTAKKIRKNAVTTAKIKNGAITAAKITAGAVGTSQLANGGVTAEKIASNAVGNSQTQFVKVFQAGAVPAVGNEETSPKIELGSVGPFHFYGKCFTEAGSVEQKTYIELTSGAAILDSEDAADFSTGYLVPTTPEKERAMEDEASAGANSFSAESSDEEFQATASNGTQITGLIGGTGAKQGSPPEGNGPFLAGDSCIVGTVAIFGA